jgi:dTDP-D-glucose 4,6-dehydratase
MKVLISGGAGYIGSTIASACLDAGITPIILDNLVTGRREFTAGRAFYQGDISDGALVDRVFAEHGDIEAVVHCAALIVVPDSVDDPVGLLPGQRRQESGVRGAPAAQRLPPDDLLLVGFHLPDRRRLHR